MCVKEIVGLIKKLFEIRWPWFTCLSFRFTTH